MMIKYMPVQSAKSLQRVITLCLILGFLPSIALAQLSSDFLAGNFEDTYNNLQKVAAAYRDHDQARAALSNTSDLERIVKVMETECSKYLAISESQRNPSLRTYMALSYFYLGYAKALVGFAEEALYYFNKAIERDADILYFQTEIANRKGLVRQFIEEYKHQLQSFATPILLDIKTYKFDESIDPSKIQFIEISQEKASLLPSFKFYLLFALENFWRYQEKFWTDHDSIKIYFPNGRFRLSSLDSTIQAIEFEVPKAKRIVVRPLHWFKLELPEKAILGGNFRIYRIEDHGEEVEITNPEMLNTLYFGHYRIIARDKHFKCIPERINFAMLGYTYHDVDYAGEKRIKIPENTAYKFQPCE